MTGKLAGKTAVVTGAGSGIGRAAGGQRIEHRQAAHTFAQVGPGRLAGLVGIAGHVEDVVGQLPGHADRLAGRLDPGHHLGRGVGVHGPEPARRGHQ